MNLLWTYMIFQAEARLDQNWRISTGNFLNKSDHRTRYWWIFKKNTINSLIHSVIIILFFMYFLLLASNSIPYFSWYVFTAQNIHFIVMYWCYIKLTASAAWLFISCNKKEKYVSVFAKFHSGKLKKRETEYSVALITWPPKWLLNG